MKIVGTIEARMGSTRLPGKVLLPLGGRPALEFLLERTRRSRYIDELVVATTDHERDDSIADCAKRMGVSCFRGNEEDVLGRVLSAAKSAEADLICELMGDSPFLDPLLIDNAITAHLGGDYDYTSNFFPENTFPMGFAVQVFSTSVLERVSQLTDDPIDRVHVSCFIYNNPKLFRLQGIAARPSHYGPDLRVCLDTSSDYELLTTIFEALGSRGPFFGAREIVSFLRANPDIAGINRHIRQKHMDEG